MNKQNCNCLPVRTRHFFGESLKALLLVFFTLLLLSCSTSNHNLHDGENKLTGGGYRVDEVGPNKFRILTKTNWTPWTNYPAARKMWQKQAEKSCGGKSYVEENVSERSYEAVPSATAPYIVTEKSGFAICQPE